MAIENYYHRRSCGCGRGGFLLPFRRLFPHLDARQVLHFRGGTRICGYPCSGPGSCCMQATRMRLRITRRYLQFHLTLFPFHTEMPWTKPRGTHRGLHRGPYSHMTREEDVAGLS